MKIFCYKGSGHFDPEYIW